VETWFGIDCVAPAGSQVRRDLPITPTRLVMDIAGKDSAAILTEPLLNKICQGLPLKIAQALVAKTRVQVEQILTKAQRTVNARLPQIKATAVEQMQQRQEIELRRLVALKKVNPGIRDDEIEHIKQQREDSEKIINRAEFQLQAIRLIVNT